MPNRCLDEWLEVTELDFGFYGEGFPESAVSFVAALRFQNVADCLILESAERGDSGSFVLGSVVGPMNVALPEVEWAISHEAILAVVRLPDACRRDVYGAVERMLHSKLCRQAGFLE